MKRMFTGIGTALLIVFAFIGIDHTISYYLEEDLDYERCLIIEGEFNITNKIYHNEKFFMSESMENQNGYFECKQLTKSELWYYS